MFNCLHLETLYLRLQNLDILFLINIRKNKIDCSSLMDTVFSVHSLSKLDFSSFYHKHFLKTWRFNKVRQGCKQHLQMSESFHKI